MKIAFSGKGGVGKTTLTALLVNLLAQQGQKVLAIDADSNPNLAAVLGFPEPEKITPIIRMKDLIAERMGITDSGGLYSLNPKVDDLTERFTCQHKGIKLVVMGAIERGGAGCACPQNSFLKSLLAQIFCSEEETIVIDMEAGLEQLGRGTAQAVDHLLIVTEPSLGSIRTSRKIYELANQLKIKNKFIIANKIREKMDISFITEALTDIPFLGAFAYHEKLREGERRSDSSVLSHPSLFNPIDDIAQKLSLL